MNNQHGNGNPEEVEWNDLSQNSSQYPMNQQDDFGDNVNQPQYQPAEEWPVFVPKKIIDYKHEHIPTFEEQLMEFRVFRVVDYRHKTTKPLYKYIKDIDVDKIIEKRKAVALRKKVRKYLENAERPEDTVSNPNYPDNWELIVKERPPKRNQRKKKLTAKILGVRERIKDEQQTRKSWTQGYVDPKEPTPPPPPATEWRDWIKKETPLTIVEESNGFKGSDGRMTSKVPEMTPGDQHILAAGNIIIE